MFTILKFPKNEESLVHFVGWSNERQQERSKELYRHCTMGIEIVDAAKVGITHMNECVGAVQAS